MNAIKKRLIKIGSLLAVSLMSTLLVLHTGLGWFADTRSAKPSIKASVQGSYFDGEGTAESPYLIEHPVQIYYLAWLQDIGIFNAAENGVIDQKYFRVEYDLDMSNYILPPIGTPTFPFVGNFDGNGKIISNLTIANDNSLTEVPNVSAEEYELSGYQIVGFFGVIGSLDEEGTIGNYTYSSEVNEVKNFLLDSITVQTKAPKNNKTLVGLAAGYVNGDMSSVGVYNGSIETGQGLSSLDAVDANGSSLTDKLSNYSLIGYSKKAVDAYTTAQGSGSGVGWGGSIDMESAYKRLTHYYGTFSNNRRTNGIAEYKNNITYRQNVYNFYDENGEFVDSVQTSSTNNGQFLVYDTDSTAGAFMFALYTNNATTGYTNNFYYLNGGIRTTQEREYYYENKSGYTITNPNGDYYLSHNADFDTVLHSTDEKVWFNDGNYYYFESYNISTTPIITHYLNADNYGRLSLSTSTTGRTTWTRTNNSMYCSKNGTNNYLLHVNGTNGGFGLSDNAYIYTFANDGKYLNLDPSSLNIVSGNSNDTEWLVTNRYIHTVINGNTYYLNANGTTGLSISTNPTTQWTFNDNKVYITNGGINYYIQPSDNNWVLIPESYLITDGTNYLQSNLGNTTTQSDAQNWIFYNNRIYTPSGTYLAVNGTSLSTTNTQNNAATWTVNNNSLITTIGGVVYYLQYSNGWTLIPDSYYITDGTNYLLNDLSNTTAQNNAQNWIFYNNRIYTQDGVYLGVTNNHLAATNQTNAATWTVNSNSLTTTVSGVTYYLQYNNGWDIIPESYYIHSGSNYLLDDLSNATAQNNAQNWIFYNNRIYTQDGVYLGVTNNHLAATNQAGAATWTVNSNSLTTTVSGVVYHLQYNNGWDIVPDSYYITDGTNYLLDDLSNTTTQNNAQNWIFYNNKIYTQDGTYLYANGTTLSTTTNANTATNWTIDDNHIYIVVDTVNYYLQYNNGWKLIPTSYYIHSGNNYLQNNLSNVTGEGNANLWIIDDNGYIYYDGYYLQNNNGTLARTNNKSNATIWTVTDNDIYNGEYYLNYNSGWKLDRFSYYITDNNGNYLRYNADTLSNTTIVGNATQWIFDNGNIKDSTQAIYLNNNDGVLGTTTTPNSSNFVMENNYIISGDYYLQYVGNSWQFLTENSRYISNGTYYLNLNGTGNTSFNSTNSVDSATVWTLSDDQNGGYIYGVYNGTKLYLRNNNGTLNLTTNQGNATEWNYDDANKTIIDGLYYLNRSNNTNTGVWQLTQATTFIISDGNGNYLRRNGDNNNSFTNTTDISQATQWTFSNGLDGGTISSVLNGRTRYLRNNNGTLQISNTSTNWTRNDDGEIYNGEYYLKCTNGTWSLTTRPFYLRNQDGYYVTGTTGNTGANNNVSNAAEFVYDGSHFKISNSNSYLNYNRSGYFWNYTYSLYLANNQNNAISLDSQNRLYYDDYYAYRDNTNYRLTTTANNADTFTLVYIDMSLSVIPTATSLTISNYSFKNMYFNKVIPNAVTHNTISMNNINHNALSFSNISYDLIQQNSITRNMVSYSNITHPAYPIVNISSNTASNVVANSKTIKHMTYRTSNFQFREASYTDYSNINYSTTYATYFPLNADAENNYTALSSNTGYIVGGSVDTTTSQGIPIRAGDIRVSTYSRTNNISGSLSGNSVNDDATYTINGSGRVTISSLGDDYFDRYSSAKENFEEILGSEETDQSQVYGLHFMNAKISKHSVVTAKHVLINGDAFENYEMPTSSIDFSLVEKGYINFFAGTYFDGNNSFFSLHQIRRNKDSTSADFNRITAIREIQKVYEINDEAQQSYAKYIYKLQDDDTNVITYETSDGKTSYASESAVLAAGYSQVFDTTWIKVSGQVTNSRLFYFEIPADDGEYCLGSVEGGTGAYLIYLDIAANGGDIDNKIMEYIGGVDFVSAADASLLAQIAENNPTACLALKTAFSDVSQKITITRTDIDATHIKFTFTSNASSEQQLQLETRYYKLTSDTREITFEFVGV